MSITSFQSLVKYCEEAKYVTQFDVKKGNSYELAVFNPGGPLGSYVVMLNIR